ncbi:MAG: GNAT family N-acetyltransferase [Gammaproteobacteria bacterium]
MDSGAAIRLRQAEMADAPHLLRWRNDDETRRYSVHPERIEWSQHLQWLGSVLQDTRAELYIAELDGQAIGSVRVDHGEDAKELSWTVAPEWRGRGVGSLMLRTAVSQIAPPLVARIHPLNVASKQVASKAGFVEAIGCDGWSVWRCEVRQE